MNTLEDFKSRLGSDFYMECKGKLPRDQEFSRTFLFTNGVEPCNVQKMFELLDKDGFWGPPYVSTGNERRIVHPDILEPSRAK